MTAIKSQTADSQARVVLPKVFAKAPVVLEQVSPTEVRIRMVREAASDTAFAEEAPTVLSNRDRDRFLEMLANPPSPTTALRKGMSKRRKRHG